MSPPGGAFGAVVLVGGFALASLLAWRVGSRSGLGIWHPAVAWLALEGLFFGVGSLLLATAGRDGPALYVGGAVAVFALALAASRRVAEHRTAEPRAAGSAADAPIGRGRLALLAAVALAALAPTILRVGIPFFAGDITGARTELIGIPVQLVRVGLAGAAIALLVEAWRGRIDRQVAAGVFVGVLLFELALASRYLPAELMAGALVARGITGGAVPRRVVAAAAAAALVVFAGVQVLRAWDQAGGRPVEFAVERTVNRLALIQPRTLEALQDVVPDEQPYFGGLTWLRRVAGALGREDVPNIGYWIYPRLYPDQPTVGYAAPGLLGEAWANLGPAGLAVFAAFGLAVERLGAFVAARRRATADVVAGALAILFVARTHALGVNGLLTLLALVAAWRLLVADRDGLAADIRSVLTWRS